MKNAESEATPSEAPASAWGNYGRTLLEVGKCELAVEALETAVRGARRNQDGHVEWLTNLGKALLELGHVKRACEAFSEACDLEETDLNLLDDGEPEAYSLLQMAARRQEGVLPDRPLPRWGGPEDSLSWEQLGRAYGAVYTDPQAIERFAKLLPDDLRLVSGAWYCLYHSYSNGNLSLAIAALERAVASYPEYAKWHAVPSLPEMIEELSASCLLSHDVDKAAACNRRLFQAIRQRRERNAGHNESRYFLVGDVYSCEVVRVNSDHVVVDTGHKSKFSIRIEEFKNEMGEIEIRVGDFAQVVVDVITAPAAVVHMDSTYVGVMIGPSSIVSNIPIGRFRNEKGEIWVKKGDPIEIAVDAAEEGDEDDNPIFIHKDTEDLQIVCRRVPQGPQSD